MRPSEPKLLRGKVLRSIRQVSLVIVVLISAVFVAFLWVLQPDTVLPSMAAAVFGASGTIVALALPAAELAGNSITRIGEYWIGRFAKSGSGSKEKRPSKEFALGEISRIKEQALTARCGSLYVLCAFVISAFSLLTPRITMQGYIFYLDYTLVAIAAGFLLLGSALFFPFTWSVYRLGALEDAEVAIKNFPEDVPSQEEPNAIKTAENKCPEQHYHATLIGYEPWSWVPAHYGRWIYYTTYWDYPGSGQY